MSYRDLPEIPDDRYELERPKVQPKDSPNLIRLLFHDEISRDWFAEWVGTKNCFEQFGNWVDARR